MGVNAEQLATPQQIASAIEFVNTNKVAAVFCESTVADAPMRRVVEATGTRFGGCCSSTRCPKPMGRCRPTWI